MACVISVSPWRAGQPDTSGYGTPKASASMRVSDFTDPLPSR